MRTKGLILHENFDRIYGNGVPIARCKFQAVTGRSLKNMAANADHFVACWNAIDTARKLAEFVVKHRVEGDVGGKIARKLLDELREDKT